MAAEDIAEISSCLEPGECATTANHAGGFLAI